MMEISNMALFHLIGLWDWLALIGMIAAFNGIGWWVESGPHAAQSTSALMTRERSRWMRNAAEREVRILDGNLLSSLQGGSAFFASACMIAIGGVVALFGRSDQVAMVAADLSGKDADPASILWEVRLLALLALLIYAFFKFAWAHRLFGYNLVLLGAIPETGASTEDERRIAADKAAAINRTAARSFNRGLRGLYFSLGAMGWFFGPMSLLASLALVCWSIHRREFRSDSRAAIIEPH